MRFAFWQRIISPHMGGLAQSLAGLGHQVDYVVETSMSDHRRKMGWDAPRLEGVNLVIAPTEEAMATALQSMDRDTIHIAQGLRGNGNIAALQRELHSRRLRHWAVLETVNDKGLLGGVKRWAYARACRRFFRRGEGLLAIGAEMPEWLEARGCPADSVFPFAYFLSKKDVELVAPPLPRERHVPVILFVGQLIARKRVLDLIRALNPLLSDWEFELWIIGDGPDATTLRVAGSDLLGNRIRWLGARQMDEVPSFMAQSDVLVLPSEHDGWGAVVSEALIAGTPSICSSSCGVADVVRHSGKGGVFETGNVRELTALLRTALDQGPISSASRKVLRNWAENLTTSSGAKYLESLVLEKSKAKLIPLPPWQKQVGENT